MTSGTDAERVVVNICTYRERENLVQLIPAIRTALPNADVLVVDDNSPDGTADFVRQYGATDPQVKLLWRPEKAGLGSAIIAGLKWATANGYDYAFTMDADFSHHPNALPALWGLRDRADVGIGSRYIPGGSIVGWPFVRHFMSRGVNFYSHIWLGLKSRDCSGGFRCYRLAFLKKLDWDKFRSKGYSFQEEMLYRCQRLGCRLAETPIEFVNRQVGDSKINYAEVSRSLWTIFVLGLDRIRGVPVGLPDHAPSMQTTSPEAIAK